MAQHIRHTEIKSRVTHCPLVESVRRRRGVFHFEFPNWFMAAEE